MTTFPCFPCHSASLFPLSCFHVWFMRLLVQGNFILFYMHYILTLWYHASLYGFGFDCMWQSKYISSPSLMSSGFNDDPIFSVTIGVSAGEEIKQALREWLCVVKCDVITARISISKNDATSGKLLSRFRWWLVIPYLDGCCGWSMLR